MSSPTIVSGTSALSLILLLVACEKPNDMSASYHLIGAPVDTAVFLGSSYQMRAQVVGEHGAPGPQEASVTGALGVSVDAAHNVTGTKIGRWQVQVKSDGFATINDSVTVVPHGEIVTSSDHGLATLNLDGSNYHVRYAGEAAPIENARPRWLPGTNLVIFTALVDGYYKERLLDADGNVTPFFQNEPARLSHEEDAAPTRDGQFVFFAAYDTRCHADAYCVHRARSDGTQVEVDTAVFGRMLAPSPDGTRVAFFNSNVIRVLNWTTKKVSSWQVSGVDPQWSPDGSQIFYVSIGDANLSVVNADGSNPHALTSLIPFQSQPFAWTPDGHWIVVRDNASHLVIFNPATGELYKLPYGEGMISADVR